MGPNERGTEVPSLMVTQIHTIIFNNRISILPYPFKYEEVFNIMNPRNWNWWWILWYKKIEPILWEYGFEISAQNLKLRGLCLYAWVFYTQKNWNFGVNSGTLNFISGLRHQKCRNELEGEFSDCFQNALSIQSVTVKFFFTIFSIKVNNKKTGILILIKPRLLGVVVTL